MSKIIILSNASSTHTMRWVNSLYQIGHSVTLITQHEIIQGYLPEVEVIELKYKGSKGYFLNKFHLDAILNSLEYDVLHAHFASGYGTLAANTGREYILSVWGSDIFRFPNQSVINKCFLKRVLNKAEAIFSTSYVMKEESLKYCDKNIHVIPFGVDLKRYSPASSPRNRMFTFGIAKVLEERYGVPILIRAFEKLKREGAECKLLIAGDGPQKSELMQLCTDLNIIDSVTFLGWINNNELEAFYSSIDVQVVPSREESFGVVVVEAAASGVPSIVSNVGGLPEVVVDNYTGSVVKSRDPESFYTVMRNYYEDRNEVEKKGLNARRHVTERYDWVQNVEAMSAFYSKYIDEKGIA